MSDSKQDLIMISLQTLLQYSSGFFIFICQAKFELSKIENDNNKKAGMKNWIFFSRSPNGIRVKPRLLVIRCSTFSFIKKIWRIIIRMKTSRMTQHLCWSTFSQFFDFLIFIQSNIFYFTKPVETQKGQLPNCWLLCSL